jgi:serine/threonine-protein kinase
MSRVWAARLRGTRGFQKVVALKTLLANGAEGLALEQMLLDEARHAAAIQHPNVAQYLDVGEHEGVLFLVMEWLDGESLACLIRNARKTCGIPLGVAVEIVAQACKGLHAAHELKDDAGHALGLVHCDVSPQNVMLTSSGAAKLIDFGVARATRGAGSGTNIVTGKMSFMAPEQIRGRDFDRRADLFSLGIVLYLLGTGQHPFPGKTPREIMHSIRVGDSLRPPSEALAGFPEALEQVILRALAHHPDARYATAAEMLAALVQAAPERADEPELATFVERVCASELDNKRRAITRALAAAPSDSQEFAIASVPPSSRRIVLSDKAPSISSTMPAISVTQPIPIQVPPRWKTKALALGLLAVGALGGAFASQYERIEASHPAAVAPAAPAARPVESPRVESPRAATPATPPAGEGDPAPVAAPVAEPKLQEPGADPPRAQPQRPRCGGKPCRAKKKPGSEAKTLQRYGI